MKILNLDQLKDGTPGITKAIGAYVVQAAAYFLELMGHESGVTLEVSGLFEENFKLTWEEEIDEPVKRSWRDSHEATEYAAVCVAALLSESLLDLSIVERSYIGTRVDYILGKAKQNEEGVTYKARMEVSGISKETASNTVNKRINVKLNQVKKSRDKNLPAYVVVIEFGKPKAKIVKDEATL